MTGRDIYCIIVDTSLIVDWLCLDFGVFFRKEIRMSIKKLHGSSVTNFTLEDFSVRGGFNIIAGPNIDVLFDACMCRVMILGKQQHTSR